MVQIEPDRYMEYVPWANRSPCNRVYPLSIAEGRQSGTIFVDALETPKSVLFWHYCGFAYISGTISERLLEEVATDVCHRSRRRMVLITDDAFAKDWLIGNGYQVADRIEYEYAGGGTRRVAHTKIDIQRIDEHNLHRITGRIVPAFSWEEERFLKDGFGFVAFERGAFCGAAFSAALCSKEVDIGAAATFAVPSCPNTPALSTIRQPSSGASGILLFSARATSFAGGSLSVESTNPRPKRMPSTAAVIRRNELCKKPLPSNSLVSTSSRRL